MKKGFTLAETLITLTIIGVLGAILVPVINNVRPDKDRITYKKALYNIQSAVGVAVEKLPSCNYEEYQDSTYGCTYDYPDDIDGFEYPLAVDSETVVCEALAEALNTIGKVDCKATGYSACPYGSSKSCYESPNFQTTDGIRYWLLEGKYETDKNNPKKIRVDRKLIGKESKDPYLVKTRGRTAKGLIINIHADGKVEVPEDSYEYNLIDDSFNLK